MSGIGKVSGVCYIDLAGCGLDRRGSLSISNRRGISRNIIKTPNITCQKLEYHAMSNDCDMLT